MQSHAAKLVMGAGVALNSPVMWNERQRVLPDNLAVLYSRG